MEIEDIQWLIGIILGGLFFMFGIISYYLKTHSFPNMF